MGFYQAKAWANANGVHFFKARLPSSAEIDPLDAICFSFHSDRLVYAWYTDYILDNGHVFTCKFINVYVQWEHLPYSPGLNEGGVTGPDASFESIGYRQKNGQ
jgi:hypothetical protein